MIRITFDDASLTRTRLATSPLWDLYCSLHLAKPARTPSWPYEQWAGRAREVLAEDERTRPLLTIREAPWNFPDFVLPMPEGTLSVAEEIDRIRHTPPDVVRRELREFLGEDLPPGYRPYAADPEAACAALADAYQAYWDEVLAPHWPVLKRLVEDEVLVRARTLATDGVDALFAGLESRGRWTPPVLELTKHIDLECAAGERRLVLVPLVFAEGCRLMLDQQDVFALSFQARGAAALRESREAREQCPGPDRLGLLLGKGRASVLRELAANPLTTAGVSDRLGVTPSTVSEHLAILAESGMASRHRVGRKVYYRLTDAGQALLSLLSGEDVLRAAG